MGKKLLAALVSIALLFGMLPVYAFAEEENGGDAVSKEWAYTPKNEKSAVITGYKGNESVVTIPAEVDGYQITAVGDRAFENNRTVRQVTVSEGITGVGHYAFSGCTALTGLALPESMASLGGRIIENTAVRSIRIPANVSKCEPAPVGGGYNGTLAGCASLTEVTFGEGMTAVPDYICASHDSTSRISAVNIPSTVTKIGEYAFYKCQSLQTLDIPSSVTEIARHAFNRCSALVLDRLPEGLENIGLNAFFGCVSITDLTLPGTIKNVGDYAFQECSGMQRLTIEENGDPDYAAQINGNAFSGCSGLTEVHLSCNIKSVGGRAFSGCTALGEVSLPEGVESIGHYAFSGCTSLENIGLPESLTTLGGCFIENTAVESIVIPKNVSKCDYTPYSTGYNGPLANCSELKTVTFADGMTAIPEYICASGAYQSNISTVNIPGSVKSVGNYALHNCKNLSSVNYSGKTEEDWDQIDLGAGNESLKDATQEFHEHEYDDGAVTDPTCTKQGFTTYTCVSCGNSKRDQFVRALGHTPVADAGRPATCTQDGLTDGSHCEVCRAVLKAQKKIKATGHTPAGSGIVSRPASCTENGILTHTCKTCGESFTEEIKAVGHSYGEPAETLAPTCTREGEMEYTCASCGDKKTEPVPALAHEYARSVKEPTCTEAGYTLYTCSSCQDSYKEDFTEVLGHRYETSEQEPTCTEPGGTAHICANCGDCYMDPEEEAYGHDFDDGVVTVPPTDTSEGVKTYTCRRCGETETESIPVHTHTYTETVVKEATCSVPGEASFLCAECGHSYTQTLPKTEHIYQAEVTEPTCTAGGYTVYTCGACGDNYQSDLTEPLAHQEQAEVTAPACTTEGYTLHTCTVCGNSYRDSVQAALGHAYDDWIVTVLPGEQSEGKRERTCTRCKETEEEVIPSLGSHTHIYDKGTVTKEASCLQPGELVYACTECGDVLKESIPKAAHTYTETLTQAASYGRNGSIQRRCAVCGDAVEGVISAPSAVILSKTAYTYTGKEIAPGVTVTDAGGSVLGPDNYTVVYTDHKKVGTAKVQVVFQGRYAGTMETTFAILPKGTSISKLKAVPKGFTVKWKKQGSQAKGYELQYAASGKFTKKTAKTKKIKKASATSATIRAKANKKYFVRIRTFQKAKGKTYYSGWSKVKKITVKK